MVTVLWLPSDTAARPLQKNVENHIAQKYGKGKNGQASFAAYEALARLYDDYNRLMHRPQSILPSIAYTDEGRPYFSDCPLDFSLTHTEGVSMAVLTDQGAVGIDAERADIKRLKSMESLARRHFFYEENTFIFHRQKNLSNEERIQRFLLLWTRKEAVFKATGLPLLQVNGFRLPPFLQMTYGFLPKETVFTVVFGAKCDLDKKGLYKFE